MVCNRIVDVGPRPILTRPLLSSIPQRYLSGVPDVLIGTLPLPQALFYSLEIDGEGRLGPE